MPGMGIDAATRLAAGNKRIRVDFLNDYYDEVLGDRNFNAISIKVSGADGQVLKTYDLRELDSIPGASHDANSNCNGRGSNSWDFNCVGFLEVPITITNTDDYTITFNAYGQQAGPDAIQMLTSVLDTDPFGQSSGAIKIRDRLVQWHELFFGDEVDPDGPEVAAVYELLVESWLSNVNADIHWLDGNFQSCNVARELNDEQWNMLWDDPQRIYGAWRLVLAYFLTDYRYIFE